MPPNLIHFAQQASKPDQSPTLRKLKWHLVSVKLVSSVQFITLYLESESWGLHNATTCAWFQLASMQETGLAKLKVLVLTKDINTSYYVFLNLEKNASPVPNIKKFSCYGLLSKFCCVIYAELWVTRSISTQLKPV